MSITAVIEKGIIKLPKDVAWASGTVVRIEPVEEQPPTLLVTLKDFDGMANDLPPTSQPTSTLRSRSFTVMSVVFQQASFNSLLK